VPFTAVDGLSSTNPVQNLVAGSYVLTVASGAGGAYQFRLLDLGQATALTPDTPATGTLNPGNSTDAYRFTAQAGASYFFALQTTGTPPTNTANLRLVDPYGNVLFSNPSATDPRALTLAQAGTYTLLVEGAIDATGTTAYTLSVTTVTSPPSQPLTARSAGARRYIYDPTFNRLTSFTDELGRQTLYTLDPNNGNILSVTQVVSGGPNVTTQFTYNAHGQVVTATDPLGRVTAYAYDADGRLTKTTFAQGTPDQATQQFQYDAAGNRTAFIDENGKQTTYQYDALNRMVQLTDPLGNVTKYGYDADGNRTSTTDARQNVTHDQYDALDRLVAVTDAKNGVTHYWYDQAGNQVAVVDPLGRETDSRYDARNRLVDTIDPAGGQTARQYDLNNNLVALTDPDGNKTTYTYDARNRLVQETDPLGNVATYAYDAADELIARTDRDGRQTQYAYDDLGRRTTETWVGAGEVIHTSYDAWGNVLAESDASGAVAFAYDALNRVKTADNGGTPGVPHVVLTYAYDPAGNVTSVTDTINGQADATEAYQYDGNNHMTQVTQTGPGVHDKRVNFTYNAVGQFATIQRFADLAGAQAVASSQYQYDALNRLTKLTHANGSGTIASYALGYDAAGQVTTLTSGDGTANYSYDPNGQLTAATHPGAAGQNESYSYDANGNRKAAGSQTGPGNQLLSDGTYRYSYDKEGNLVSRTTIATGAVRQFQWDYRNRLVVVTDQDAAGNVLQTVRYTYDPFDRRIVQAVRTALDTAFTEFVYDRENVLIDFTARASTGGPGNAVVAQHYLYGPAVDQVLAQEDGSGKTLWLLADHEGTVRDLIDSSGKVANHLTYDSLGKLVAQTNAAAGSRYGFAGRELSAETGLYYYRARYYDPALGRFLSADPLGLKGGDANLYRYVNNAPVRWTDPLGLAPGDKFFGLPSDFWSWYHRQVKQPGDPDLTKDQADELYDEWQNLGQPDAEGHRTTEPSNEGENQGQGGGEGGGNTTPSVRSRPRRPIRSST
jgi:RHS repeat-associated protein